MRTFVKDSLTTTASGPWSRSDSTFHTVATNQIIGSGEDGRLSFFDALDPDANMILPYPSRARRFRCGFLGLLHADVFHQRLREEFDADVVATAPTVSYRVRYPDTPETSFEDVASPAALDEKRLHQSGGRGGAKGVIEEPMVDATIICPADAVGKVVELCVDRRGSQLEHAQLGVDRVMLRYRLPSAEIAVDFSDELKSRTSGYATFDYDDAGYEPSDIVRLDILVNGEAVDALSSLTHRDKAARRGRDMCARLKEALPRQVNY